MAIPRRNKETALFNPDKSVEGASRTATRYLAKADQTGVMVHPEGDETTGWKISSAIELLKSGTSYIKLWLESSVAKLRLGLENAGHAIFSPDGMEVFTDASTSVAKFGATSTIGQESALQLKMAPGSMTLENDTDETVFSVVENMSSTTTRTATAAVFSGYPDTGTYTVSDPLIVVGNVNASYVCDEFFVYLDSSHFTSTVTAGTGVSITLTQEGVDYITSLMEGSGIAGILNVDYEVGHYDKAQLDIDGAISVSGEGVMVKLHNGDWSSSNKTGTYLSTRNTASGHYLLFGIGEGGTNRGIYDNYVKRWILCSDASNNTIVNGNNVSVSASGKLSMKGVYPSASLYSSLRSTRLGASAPSETQYFGGYYARDKNNDVIFYTETGFTANKDMYRSFVARRYSSNGQTAYTNGFYLHVDNSGNPTVSFTTGGAAAWRDGMSAAAKTWTQIKTWSGTAQQSWSMGSYSEFLIVARYSTSFVGSALLPAAHITSTAREVYVSGGYNGAGVQGRGFALTLSSTTAKAAIATADGTDRLSSTSWWIYGR